MSRLCKKWFRCFNHSTPEQLWGMEDLVFFQILFDWVSQGKNIPVFSGGNNIYQFVHADDLAEACILAGDKRVPEFIIVALTALALCVKF